MKHIWALSVVLMATSQVEVSAQTLRPGKGPVTVELTGPLVLGFFPPFTQKEEEADDGGIREGLAHGSFALEAIAECFGPKAVT